MSKTKANATLSSTPKKVVSWLVSFLVPYKKQVTIAIIALGISAATWLIIGQGIRLIIDKGFENNQSVIPVYMILGLLVISIGSIATFFRFYFMVWLGERVSADIRLLLFNHLMALTPAFYERERTGEIISRFTSDTTLLQTVIGTSISMTLRSSVIFIGSLILMLFTSPKLTFYVFLAIPLVLIPVKLLSKQVRTLSKESQNKVAAMGALIDENLHEIKTVQAFTSESDIKHKFASAIEAIIATASARIRARAALIGCVMWISMIAISLIAWLGINSVLSGNVSNGELVAFMFYAVMAGGSIATISELIGEIQKAAGASERIIELLNSEIEISESGDEGINTNYPMAIEMCNVNFGYSEKLVLENISIKVQKGENIAFVGHSGAGKSTLFDLILRFYDIQSGSIKIFGTGHTDCSLKTLRSQFGLVSQDPVIFAGNVYENIAFGSSAIEKEKIEEAAKLAFADIFIEELTDGYNTQLGERGIKLSGGQKQRIAIARAIAADRPILILDEATSALDAKSEQMIKQALDALMRDKTTLIIAHRLSTVINADKIYVFENGEITAYGKHKDLYQSNASYREFVDLQLVE